MVLPTASELLYEFQLNSSAHRWCDVVKAVNKLIQQEANAGGKWVDYDAKKIEQSTVVYSRYWSLSKDMRNELWTAVDEAGYDLDENEHLGLTIDIPVAPLVETLAYDLEQSSDIIPAQYLRRVHPLATVMDRISNELWSVVRFGRSHLPVNVNSMVHIPAMSQVDVDHLTETLIASGYKVLNEPDNYAYEIYLPGAQRRFANIPNSEWSHFFSRDDAV